MAVLVNFFRAERPLFLNVNKKEVAYNRYMDPKRIVALVVGASVMVLIFSAILVPIIGEATKTEKTFENVGDFEMTFDERDSVTIVWDGTNPLQMSVNGEVVPLDASIFTSSQRRSVLMSDDFCIRTNAGGGEKMLQYNGPTGSSIFFTTSTMTIVCENGAYTVYKDENSVATGTYTYLYTLSNNGEFVMKYKNTPAYVLGNSEIYAMGTSKVADSSEFGVKITGNVEDGVNITTWRGGDWNYTDISVNATAVDNYVDLYSLASITATATSDDDAYTGTITYSYFLVPTEVTAEMTVHADDGTRALLSAIPIIAMIGIVLAVVGVAIVGRNDY